MLVRKIVGLPAAIALVFSPSMARAQSCSALRADYSQADRSGRSLTQENPGISLIAFGCMTTAMKAYNDTGSETEAVATFALCGGLGCNLATGGYQNCISVGAQIIGYAIRVAVAKKQIEQQGCGL